MTVAPRSAGVVLRDSHRKVVECTLDTIASTFRRSTLSDALYPTTSPRSRTKADKLADAALKWLSKAGRIERSGHLHWVKAAHERTLRSGRSVPELGTPATLTLSTRCPRKWLSIDLETGDVWAGEPKGWRRATSEERKEALACLSKG